MSKSTITTITAAVLLGLAKKRFGSSNTWYEEDTVIVKGSGYNTFYPEKFHAYREAMIQYGGWGDFPPVQGWSKPIEEEELEEYQEAEEGGYAHELDYNQPLSNSSLGKPYVYIYDGHHRALAAASLNIPIRIEIANTDSESHGSKAEILHLNLPEESVFQIKFRLYDDDKGFIDSFINGFNGIQSDMFVNMFRISLASLNPEDLGLSGFVDFRSIADLSTLTVSGFSYQMIEYEGPKGVESNNPFAAFFEKNLSGFNRYDFDMTFSVDLIEKHTYKKILKEEEDNPRMRDSAANEIKSLIGTSFIKTLHGMYDKRVTPTAVNLIS